MFVVGMVVTLWGSLFVYSVTIAYLFLAGRQKQMADFSLNKTNLFLACREPITSGGVIVIKWLNIGCCWWI